MIIGIGCDIVDHKITSQLNWDTDPRVISRIFSKKEIDLYQSKKEIKFLAGRFAAKEAVLKSLNTGMQDGISLVEIQILKSDKGKPVVSLEGKVKEIADKLGIKIFHVSISHSEGYSIAYAIAESHSV